MHLHMPDPAYTSSERAQANFRLAVKLAVVFVALLWLIQLTNAGLGLGLERFGVRPRAWAGLPGILAAPLLHSGFAHLTENSLPLLVMVTGMLYLYPYSSLKVIPAVYLGPGAFVWLVGRPSAHVGASGLIYGLVAYIFLAGLIRRDRRAVAASLLVYFLYATLAWGVFPLHSGLSWETHLAAVLIGLTLAFFLRRFDMPPRKRYDWEDEVEQPQPGPGSATD